MALHRPPKTCRRRAAITSTEHRKKGPSTHHQARAASCSPPGLEAGGGVSFSVEMNRVRVAPFSPRKGGLIAPVKRRRPHQCLRFDLDHDLACESRHRYLSLVESTPDGRIHENRDLGLSRRHVNRCFGRWRLGIHHRQRDPVVERDQYPVVSKPGLSQ